MNRWVWLCVSWFGVSGLFKRARGTWGTLAALPCAYLVQVSLGNIALAAVGCGLFALGVIASEAYVQTTGKQDPGEIVIDEVAAIFILLAFMAPNWECYLVAFVVFRLFDVLKPWPVSIADQRIKGGLGVMVDDVLASLYPIAIFFLIKYSEPALADGILTWMHLN